MDEGLSVEWYAWQLETLVEKKNYQFNLEIAYENSGAWTDKGERLNVAVSANKPRNSKDLAKFPKPRYTK